MHAYAICPNYKNKKENKIEYLNNASTKSYTFKELVEAQGPN